MPDHATTHDLEISIDGAKLSSEVAATLLDLEVEATYNRPDLCILRFNIGANEEPPPELELANELKISAVARERSSGKKVIFQGEITAIEFEYVEQFSVCVVQAQDPMHRLFRGNKHAAFLQLTYSDIVGKLLGESGLTAGSVDSTGIVHDHLIQHDETAGDLVTRLANEVNFYVKAEEKKVNFREVGSGASTGVTLEFGGQLISLNARVTTASQLTKATVRGWDPMQKNKVQGVAESASARKAAKVESAVQKTIGVGEITLAAGGAPNHLEAIATAVMERSVEPNAQLDAACFGEPRLKVDGTVIIDKVNNRFNGEYRISRLRHRYSPAQGLTTEFSCRGGTEQSLSELVAHTASSERAPVAPGHTLHGCAIGIVTNNEDPDKIGRVKVKFPGLDDTVESHWYRLVLPGAGGSGGPHGWYLLPEVNDEVLVVFERNDPRLGYVVGGLFNGKDKPPIEQGTAVASGKVNQHAFYTKNGGFLLFDDKEGAEAIELKSGKAGNFDLRFEESKGLTLTNKGSNVITVSADGDITIESKKGNINLKAAAGKIVMAAKDIEINASANVKLEGKAGAEMKGMTAKVEAQTAAELKGAMTTVSSSGITEVKGSLVKIN